MRTILIGIMLSVLSVQSLAAEYGQSASIFDTKAKTNTIIVGQNDDIAAAYAALKTHSGMGTLSAANQRYLVFMPGEYILWYTVTLDTSYVNCVEMVPGTVTIRTIGESQGIVVASGVTAITLTGDGSSVERAVSGSNTVYVTPIAGDASAAIQAALNKIASTGGTVIIPDGIYYMGSTVTIPGNDITIEAGRGAIFRPLSNHTFTKVDYRSNGTYDMVPMFYATGRSNVHFVGGKIDFDWAETELTIKSSVKAAKTVTINQDLTGVIDVGDIVYTFETSDPSNGTSTRDGTVSVVDVNEVTDITTLTISTLATGLAGELADGDKLMYGGPLTKTGYTDVSWAPIWFDQCTDSTVEDVYVDSGGYYVDMDTGRGYCVLFSRCIDCKGVGIKGYRGGYECFGIRDSNLRTGFVNCTARYGRRHSAQIADWAPTVAGTGRNESCYFSAMDCDDTIIIHGGSTRAERKHKIINCTAATIQISGNVTGAIVSGNQVAYMNQLLLGNHDQKDNIFTNNIIDQDESSGPKFAMKMYADETTELHTFYNSIISNNVIRGGRVLITADGDADENFNVEGLQFTNNVILNDTTSNHGIDLDLQDGSNVTLNDIRIQGNLIDVSTATPTAVINVNGKDSRVNRLFVTGNSLIGGYYTYNTPLADADYRQDDFYFTNNMVKSGNSILRFNGNPDINGVCMLNNWLYSSGYVWSDVNGTVSGGWIDGNYFSNWLHIFPTGNGAPIMGLNNSTAGASGVPTLLWRTRVDLSDTTKFYLEQNQAGTWTVVDNLAADAIE